MNGAVAAWPAEDAPDVSPPTSKTTDISKISLTVPMVAALAVSVGMIVGAFYSIKSGDDHVTQQIQSDVRDIRTRMDNNAENEALKKEYLDQRFAALEAQITAAGLRNANMALAQELAKQRGR